MSTSVALCNAEAYPYFFRTVPSDIHQAKAMMELLEMFDWHYASIVHSDSEYGTKGSNITRGFDTWSQIFKPRGIRRLNHVAFCRKVTKPWWSCWIRIGKTPTSVSRIPSSLTTISSLPKIMRCWKTEWPDLVQIPLDLVTRKFYEWRMWYDNCKTINTAKWWSSSPIESQPANCSKRPRIWTSKTNLSGEYHFLNHFDFTFSFNFSEEMINFFHVFMFGPK